MVALMSACTIYLIFCPYDVTIQDTGIFQKVTDYISQNLYDLLVLWKAL